MTFVLYKISDDDFRKVITINTIEELKNLYPSVTVYFDKMEIWIDDGELLLE